MTEITNKTYFSTTEAAKILGMSRIAVFKKIKSGKLPADRFGRNYLITRDSLVYHAGLLTPKRKKELSADVRKIINQYGEVLKKLARE